MLSPWFHKPNLPKEKRLCTLCKERIAITLRGQAVAIDPRDRVICYTCEEAIIGEMWDKHYEIMWLLQRMMVGKRIFDGKGHNAYSRIETDYEWLDSWLKLREELNKEDPCADC